MRFRLKAVDAGDRVIEVEFDAADEIGAREQAVRRGYSVLDVARRKTLSQGLSRAGRFPTVLFSIELLSLLDAGLNVVEALNALAEKEPRGEHRRVLEELLGALRRGEALSQAVAAHPVAFSALYVATVKASERTGDLKEALSRFVAYQEEMDKVRRKVVAALLYPAILLVVGALVMLFLLLYVVPRFAKVYEDVSRDLPLFSSLLLAVGRAIEQHGFIALGVLAAGLSALVVALAKAELRQKLLDQVWRIPALGARFQIYQFARLYRTLAMLLRAGIPALQAFERVSGLLSASLRPRMATATAALREGRGLSESLTAAGLATPIATRMMAVGEKSGRMAELLERIARFYDDETARWVDAFIRVFEPVLMAVLGLAVGLVVVLMYMPVFELAGSLQ